MPLGAYLWHTATGIIHRENGVRLVTLPMGTISGPTPARTLVKSIATVEASFSVEPSSPIVLSAGVVQGLSCRATMWAANISGTPPDAQLDPYGTGSPTDLWLGWSELVCGAVAQGGDGSYTLKYSFPGGFLVSHAQRKVNTVLRTGITVALFDTESNWSIPSTDPLYTWSAMLGLRSLFGTQL